MFSSQDQYWMQRALELAAHAASQQEVPVGAILVLDNQLIGEGWNSPITHSDPSAHAEIKALRMGAKKMNNYRLLNSTLYVTLEPCMMCAGALVHARIKKLIFGAYDFKAGVIESVAKTLSQSYLNHRVEWRGGLMAEECRRYLSEFFQERRER